MKLNTQTNYNTRLQKTERPPSFLQIALSPTKMSAIIIALLFLACPSAKPISVNLPCAGLSGLVPLRALIVPFQI